MIVRIKLSYPQYSVVDVGNKGMPIYLPPEVCEVLPGQGLSPRLDASQTGKMIKFTNMQGYKKANLIANKGISIIGLKSNEKSTLINVCATLIVSLSISEY